MVASDLRKRLGAASLAVALVFGGVACSSDDESDTVEQEVEDEVQEEVDRNEQIEDEVEEEITNG